MNCGDVCPVPMRDIPQLPVEPRPNILLLLLLYTHECAYNHHLLAWETGGVLTESTWNDLTFLKKKDGLIKATFVKDFDHFVDRRNLNFRKKIVRKWLSILKGQEWKDIRSSVTPAFTTGKIKRMSLLIKDCVAKLCSTFKTVAQSEGKMDAKLTFSALTMDVIARCAFGLKIDTLDNKDDPFIKNAQFIFNPPSSKTPLSVLNFMYPKLFAMIGESLFVTKELKFFFELIENMMRERAQSEQMRPSLNLRGKLTARRCQCGHLRAEEIKEIVMGQSTLFMLAGFDTTATTLTNTCFQLARNPDIQEKLHETILRKLDDYGDVCHETVQDMPYLEQIIQEVLRFYPPVLRIERQCTKDISYDYGNGRIHIKKGMIVTVPAYALHHMEEYYPEPETFDPERYVTSTFNYFSDQGIPGPKPVPLFGNMWGIWRKNISEHDVTQVKKYGKVFGWFDGPQPNLWITDVELIKAIFVKDFDHFADRRTINFKTKVVRKWLTVMRGQEWKDIRSSVTPAFTTGKIKRMSLLIKDCVDKLNNTINAVAQSEGKMNAKLTFSAFTMDVIARCAFGLKIDNLGDKDDPFIKNAQFIFNPPTMKTPLILLPFMYPKLFSMVGESLFVTKQLKFFLQLLENMLRERAQSEQKYNDFIEVADEAISEFTKKVDGKPVPMWSPEEIKEIVMGQSTLFMLAGFDTTATTLTNTCFQLARNPDIQEKLHETILRKLEDYEDVCHEMVQDMPYLEQIIHEVLRFYPPALRIERQCTKDISYDYGNGRVYIKKGVLVTVPVYALHHLEEYYPDHETFDPERWDQENKANRSPYSFMAFGSGPRNCVGMRFAMEELKVAISALVQQFRFFPVAETPEKLRFDDGFQTALQPINAIVGIERRQSN
uniref:Uncharacterized protein n=1 Tax=Daphnia galeata TaxID=27404 RepID=A0A8J2WDK4_9CRUS|nr:unnamed protein product [Daphnia galeata]